jgi:hypothetical protein
MLIIGGTEWISIYGTGNPVVSKTQEFSKIRKAKAEIYLSIILIHPCPIYLRI